MPAAVLLSIFGLPRWRKVLVVLGLLFVLLLALIPFAAHSYRLAGLPDVPEPFDVKEFGHVEVAPSNNAFELYRVASEKLTPLNGPLGEQYTIAINGGWQAATPDLHDWLERNRAALELYRQGSERPEAVYHQPQDMNFATLLPVIQNLRDLAKAARLEALRLEAGGDVAGAWNWHRVVFRSSRHSGLHGCMIERLVGNALHAMATESSVRWSARPGVGASELRTALNDVRAIYKTTAPASGPLKVEYLSFVNLLDDPGALDSDARSRAGLPGRGGWLVLYPLGEPEMSRRVAKLAWTNWLSECDRPRRLRSPVSAGALALFDPVSETGSKEEGRRPDQIEAALKRSYVARLMIPATQLYFSAQDREAARQGLLEALLALQFYHRERNEYPDSLDNLVGIVLDIVPVDPFGNGEPLHYRREQDPAEGCTIWSIGPDGVNDDGRIDVNTSGKLGDIILNAKPPSPDSKLE